MFSEICCSPHQRYYTTLWNLKNFIEFLLTSNRKLSLLLHEKRSVEQQQHDQNSNVFHGIRSIYVLKHLTCSNITQGVAIKNTPLRKIYYSRAGFELSCHIFRHCFLNGLPSAILHRESKKQDNKLLPITFPNINRFSKSLRYQTQW